jgi:K+ transporter
MPQTATAEHDPPPDETHARHATPGGRALALTALGALGVVYGDIGTSPLYAVKECLAWPHSPHAVEPTPVAVLGVMSLVFWSLITVVVVKYLWFVLRADNKGEGGILALGALVEGDRGRRSRCWARWRACPSRTRASRTWWCRSRSRS